MENYDNMYLLSEVCKITGLTKKIVRGYNKTKDNPNGLLCPSTAPNGKYLLYSENDLEKLILIAFLSECGLNRKEIIKQLETDYENIIEHSIEMLEDKKNQIDINLYCLKVINILSRSHRLMDLPYIKQLYNLKKQSGDSIKKLLNEEKNMLSSMDLNGDLDFSDEKEEFYAFTLWSIQSQIINGDNISSIISSNSKDILEFLEVNDEKEKELHEFISMALVLTFGQLKNCPIDSQEIKNTVFCFFDYIFEITRLFKYPNATLSDYIEEIKYLLNNNLLISELFDDETNADFDEIFGNGSSDFMMKAIKYHAQAYINEAIMKGE